MTRFLIGDIYLQQDKIESAEPNLSEALRLQPGLAEAKLDLAKIYRSQGKTEQAVRMLQALLASDPDEPDAHYLLFNIYKGLGQMEEARKELQTFEALKRKTSEQEEKRMRLDSTN